jgi:hypothetical protein
MNIIERICVPNKYDNQPQNTLCRVAVTDKETHYYIQLGPLEEPDWQPIHALLKTAFKNIYDDPIFIEELLALVDSPEKSYDRLATILKSSKR